MPRPFAPWFDNPVYRLERGTGPLLRYLARATFPAWALAACLPIAGGLIIGLSTGPMTVNALMPAAMLGWALLIVYPAWAGRAVLARWFETGKLDAVRLTSLTPEEMAQGLAVAAGVRAAFVAGAVAAGLMGTSALMMMMQWARTGDLNPWQLAAALVISAAQMIVYVPFVLAPNVLVGLWAGLRWRRSAAPWLGVIAAVLVAEIPVMMFCGLIYLGGKSLIGWLAWRETLKLLRRLKDAGQGE